MPGGRRATPPCAIIPGPTLSTHLTMVPLRPPGVRKAAEKKGKRVRGPGGWPELVLDKTETSWQKQKCGVTATHMQTRSVCTGLRGVCELHCHLLGSRSLA